jgi:hypothetical protein
VTSSPVVTSLRLLSPSNLEVTIYSADGRVVQSNHNLDNVLGNDNGDFSAEEKNFSQSARGVRLVDYSLWALLCTEDGVWHHDKVGLDIEWQSEEAQVVQVKIVDYRDSHTPSLPDPKSRLASSSKEDIRGLIVISNFLLAADCLQLDGSFATSFIDLDGYIGNEDGRFGRGTDFSHTAEDVKLSGTTLSARLAPLNGSKVEASTDISRYFYCAGGRLRPFQTWNPGYEFPPVHQDSCEIIGLLPGCQRVLIINSSILLADCYTNRGFIQKSAYRLDDLFGITGGRLRPFGCDFTKGDEPAKKLELKGSTLYMEVPQPANEEEEMDKIYKPYVVDLRRYLINVDGVFTL